MYTLDTNAVIYYLAGIDLVTEIIDKEFQNDSVIYIPSVVRLELLSKSDILRSEYSAIMRFLSQCRSIPLDDTIADIAADMRRLYGIKTPDSIIAATALFTDSDLVTRNYKDFKKVINIRVLKI